jgi:hypothetical protein
MDFDQVVHEVPEAARVINDYRVLRADLEGDGDHGEAPKPREPSPEQLHAIDVHKGCGDEDQAVELGGRNEIEEPLPRCILMIGGVHLADPEVDHVYPSRFDVALDPDVELFLVGGGERGIEQYREAQP